MKQLAFLGKCQTRSMVGPPTGFLEQGEQKRYDLGFHRAYSLVAMNIAWLKWGRTFACMTLPGRSSPRAYKQVSCRFYPVPGSAVCKQTETMAILRPLFLPLGLLLCLWLLCSPASCTNSTTNCKPFLSVTTKKSSLIHISPDVYKSNTLYTGK